MISKAIKDSIPVLLCYLPLGIVYGFLFVDQGLPPYCAPLFSLFVYAGAVQFLAITFCTVGGSLLMLLFATVMLSIRNIFYTVPMGEDYQRYPPLLRGYLAFALVDATFAILSLKPERDVRYVTALTVVIHFYWVAGAALGAFLYPYVSLPGGLEFTLAAFFTASSVSYLLKHRTLFPLLIAALSAMIALSITRDAFFVIAVIVAMTLSLLIPRFIKKRAT